MSDLFRQDDPYANYVVVSPPESRRSVWFSPELHQICEQAIAPPGVSLKEELLTAIEVEIQADARLPTFLRGHCLHPYIAYDLSTPTLRVCAMREDEAWRSPEMVIECVKVMYTFRKLPLSSQNNWKWCQLLLSRRLKYRLAKASAEWHRTERDLTQWTTRVAVGSELLHWHKIAGVSIFAFREVRNQHDIRVFMMLDCEWPRSSAIPF